MNIKTFLFWSGVCALAIVISYLIIEWLKSNGFLASIKPKREIGFHAIIADHEAMAVG
jgi:phage host-nuclease inhibitor protein Gam